MNLFWHSFSMCLAYFSRDFAHFSRDFMGSWDHWDPFGIKIRISPVDMYSVVTQCLHATVFQRDLLRGVNS